MTAELRAAVKVLSQKVQRCETAMKRKDYPRAALELKLIELATKDVRQLVTESPMEATSGH